MSAAPDYNWHQDKTILVPKGLLIEGVCGEELAVYCKMKSFGPEARASLKALATRLDWDEKKVRKFQASLWKKGWIYLMVEGGNKKPRHWYLANNAGELPPPEILEAATKGVPVPPQMYQGTQIGQGADFVPPTNPVPETNKETQTNKDIPTTNDSATAEAALKAEKGRAIGALLWSFKELWNSKFKDKYISNGQDAKAAEGFWADGVTPDAVAWRTPAFLDDADPYLIKNGHTFSLLRWRWNNYKAGRKRDTTKPEFEG